jgi:hypothetical protein
MVSALSVLFRGGSRRLSPHYAMLAVLGLGLFAYYQGRSVVPNLYYVAWPAYLICGLFLGDLTRQSRRWLLRLHDPWQGTDQMVQVAQLATVVFSLCLLFASAVHCEERVGMLFTWPEYQANYRVYKQDWRERIRPVAESLPAADDQRPVLVLSARDHLWHLFLKQPSVLSNAGFNHIFRADEFENLCRLIEERQIACVVWDETYLQTPMPEIQYGYVSQTEKGRLLDSLRKSYRVAAIHAGKGDLPFSVWVPSPDAASMSQAAQPAVPDVATDERAPSVSRDGKAAQLARD